MGTFYTTPVKSEHVQTVPDQATVCQDINAILKRWYEQQATSAQELDPAYGELWNQLQSLGLAGGKRLRPYLTILSYTASGGNDLDSILRVGAGEELLHTSLLIHDDIIDRDLKRYGQSNIAGFYQKKYAKLTTESEAQHYAMGAALLAGDLALSGSYQLIMQSAFTAEQKLLALEHLSSAIFTVAGGEFLDTEAVLLSPSEAKSLIVAELKTASYSFVGPLLLGAVLAGSEQSQKQYFITLGSALGIAYQLSDDLLGLFGTESVTGKPVTSDIREGKQTYLLQKIIASSTKSEKQFIEQCLHNPKVTKADIVKIRNIAIKNGAKAEVEDRIRIYAKEARASLQSLHLPSPFELAFTQLIQKVLWRDA